MDTSKSSNTRRNGTTTTAPPPDAPPLEKPAATTTQAITPARPPTAFELIKQRIGERMEEISQALPEHLRNPAVVKRWERVIVSCIAKTPLLQKCTVPSLLQSIQQAAQLGLEPTGVLGSAYLVPYRTKNKGPDGKPTEGYHYEAQMIPGYRGLIDLARRSGQIESIEARVVHANDRFKAHFGTDSRIEHEPAWEGERGMVKAFYAVAKLKGGMIQIEVMTKGEIDAIKARSKSKDQGPWITDYTEMGRKTVVRRIAKYLPLTPELADAFAADDADFGAQEDEAEQAQPKGVAGAKGIVVKASQATVEAEAGEEEPPHDEETGEVIDDGAPTPEEQAEIAAREAAEASAAKS